MSDELNLTDALVYSALYSRTSLSEKNGWIDADGRIYISYSVENLSEDLHKGTTVVKAALRKLIAAGLIETKRNFGAPNTIYVKLPEGRKSVQQSVGIPTHEQSEKRPIDSRNTDQQSVGIPTHEQSEKRPIDSRNTDQQSVGIPTANRYNRTTRDNRNKRTKPARQKYGSYGNVLLTTEEYQKLHKDIPNLDSLIEQLSTYMESKGKRYKNHAATLRNWAARDKSRQKPPHSGGIPNYSYKEGESL